MLGPRFVDALGFATDKTGDQKRKGTEVPYICHPLAVCSLVLEDGGDEDEAIAALLHDLVEDRGPTLSSEIESRFGERVISIVLECSDSVGGPRDATDWKKRKEEYLEGLRVHSPGAIRVSLADKLHNARSILRDLRAAGPGADEVWTRFNVGREDQLWYYRSLVRVFGEVSTSSMVMELSVAVDGLG